MTPSPARATQDVPQECRSWITSEWESPYHKVGVRCQALDEHVQHWARLRNPDTGRTQLLRWGKVSEL